MVAKTIARKKDPEIVKEELLKLLSKSDTVEEKEFSMQNIIDQREAVNIVKPYKEIMKTIRCQAIRGQMLKKLKNMEVLSRSVTYS